MPLIRTSPLDDVSPALPALAEAEAMSRRAATVGFDWEDVSGVLAKVDEELAELREALAEGPMRSAEARHELGDLLQAVANLARWLDIPAEAALHEANERFSNRFRTMEMLATERQLHLKSQDAASLDALWREAKERCR